MSGGQVKALVTSFRFIAADKGTWRIYFHRVYSEGRNDNVIRGNDEDEDEDDVVQNVSGSLLFGIVNVHGANNHEEYAHQHLKQ